MNLLGIILLAQLATPTQHTAPVLSFPEPGLDDSAAYGGYRTRFFRDAAGNTVQIYLEPRGGRVVHLWADASNSSAGFSARDGRGAAVPLRWGGEGAEIDADARTRSLEYELVAEAPVVNVGWFLLGSMRVERDFQYAERHRAPFDAPPFTLPEIDRLLEAIGRLAPAERRRHLALLDAADVDALRARLQPRVTTSGGDSSWVARIVQPSLDGRDTMSIELRVDPRAVRAERAGDSLTLRARSGNELAFSVRITTDAAPLTPLGREEIFSAEFLDFLDAARTAADADTGGAALRARWMERQVRGVELLSSREKLMAGLPNYATYFGRDMLVAALMMRPIWRDEMSEFVVASVLRKLSPSGQVSHEEALGGQAVRESAAAYAALVDAHLEAARDGRRAAADSLLGRAREVLGGRRRVRENYHMIDDELQLPILAERWLADADVPAARKRAFLLDDSDGGGTRLERLLAELALVARMTAPYAAEPVAANLVSFPAREPERGAAPDMSPRWASTSWRDSGAGYAGGRFAMDVNAIWAPHALASTGRILAMLDTLGFDLDSLGRTVPALAAATPLGRYARDPVSLRRAVETWHGASRHFVVRLSPAEVRARVSARLAALPADERAHWTRVLAATGADRDSLDFLALSLDADGRPIGVANSDPATRLFLVDGAAAAAEPQRVMRDVRLFVRAYPVGLFIEGVGPVVANDAYATPRIWAAFERDRYHGPRVVWGREVNLFLAGVAELIAAAPRQPPLAPQASELRAALERISAAVEASGFQSELWSYEIEGGGLIPVRYGTGSDVQLWSTTDLAVQWALSRLGM